MTGDQRQKCVSGFLSVLVLMGAGLAAWAETIQYAYDPMGRLTRAESDAAAVRVYAYDTMGNRVTKTTTGSPLEVGVVAAYPFSEGSGPTTADVSGHGHDGTITGATWTTDGKVGNALSFDGVDDYVQVTHSDDLNVTDAFTLTAWINTDLSQRGTLLSKDGVGSDPTGAYNLYIWPSGVVQYETNNLESLYTSGGAVTANTWHHVVVTFDATASPNMHIYVDGVEEVAGDVIAPSAISSDLLIGRRGTESDPIHFTGKADEVTIYNRALPAQDVLELYRSSGLVASYPFSEGSGTSTADASGNGHDGTLLNGVSWTTNGKVGNALSFDGIDDYVEIADEAAFDVENTDAFSIAAWINVEDVPYWQKVVSKLDNTGPPYPGYELIVTDAGAIYVQLLNAWPSSVLAETTTATGFDDQQWHHLVATYDGSSSAAGLKIYVDGAEATTTVDHETLSGSILNDVSVKIGRRTNESLSGFVKGTIDEVTIYDRAFSASEVQDLAGVGGSATFAATSFSNRSAPLSVGVDPLVEVDGAYVSINVGESPDLNYGIGDFTVMVTARTVDAANAGSAGILPAQEAGGAPALPGTVPQEAGEAPALPGWSHTAIGVRQGKDLFLYLDGALQAQKTVGAGRITRLKVNVGLDDVSTHAIIEDVRLFPYAPSPEEIAD